MMTPYLAMFSAWDTTLILVVVLLLFGGKKLPELARGIGEAIKEFKKSQRDVISPDSSHPASTPNPGVPQPEAPAPAKLEAQQKPGEQKKIV